jgi:SAM-dependent methyltransferase
MKVERRFGAARDVLAGVPPLRATRRLLFPKQHAELRYWRGLHTARGGRFTNDFYEPILLALAGDVDLEGKVVADFGCGPQGSLTWASSATVRIGIDVLASRYADEFPELLEHGMIYVTSTETRIPLPTDSVDLMFSLNALDHVANFEAMCAELVRVLRPGGLLAASLNLDEPATAEEPQRLTEERVRASLLDRLVVESYRIAGKPEVGEHLYLQFTEGEPTPYIPGMEGILWVRARKVGGDPRTQ